MKSTKNRKSLVLHTETVRALQHDELTAVNGGIGDIIITTSCLWGDCRRNAAPPPAR